MSGKKLEAGQLGLGDMEVTDFRQAAHRVADMVADYLEGLEAYAVLPDIKPGVVRDALQSSPPCSAEPIETILEDYSRLIEPNITHWQHPGFMAYFCSVASGPGILGEWLAAGLNSNVMLWRNAPASTEVEEVVVSWLRQMLGLPETFDGMLTDTASISTLTSIVAARHGHTGQSLCLYCSEEAHSSVEKAAIVTGIGRSGVRRIGVDSRYRMNPECLAQSIAEDRRSGRVPFCVVATLGTTSSTSVDPVARIAEVCREAGGIWLHVDAAYGGSAAIVPELRTYHQGWELADSIVVNPHKWMFTPFDASLLLFRKPEIYRQAFSLVPEYLKTRRQGEAHDFHEYGIQLGRRFRALKLWIMLRYFGVDGFVARIREHCRMAQQLCRWIESEPEWEIVAPVPFSTVCFRHVLEGSDEDLLDDHNQDILDHVNASGQIFLSHTKLGGHFVLRVTLGNPRATMKHLERCWELLREGARKSAPSRRPSTS